MNTNYLKTIITAIALMLSLSANAYDFEVDGIYYNVLSMTDLTCSVTSGDNKYSGNVIIPEKATYAGMTFAVTSIGNYAFYGCTGLTSVTIGNSVTSIGDKAFYYCEGLRDIYVNWQNPLTNIGTGVFIGVDKTDCTLHVPVGTLSKYKSADVWKSFGEIKEWDAVGIENIAKDSQLQPTMNGSIIDFSGQRVTNPVKGQMYIINGKKVYYR